MTTSNSSFDSSVYENIEPVINLSEDEMISKRLTEIKHPSDLTLFEFSLLSADYINSYAIPLNVQQVVENALPNVFMDQSRKTPLPLSSHPYDSGSMYQFFRTPKFDNIACLMEDTISQPFNSFHFYFNSNKKNQARFGGIDSSSTGSSHRTKVIVNTNVSGYMVPRAKDGTGYITNNINSGGIHVYTADNFYMTVDREIHWVSNTDGYLKFGQNLNVIVGSRKSKPAVAVIPRDFYEKQDKFKLPDTETNIELQNNLNLLSHDNEYSKITSTSQLHLRVTKESYLKSKEIDGTENVETFKNVDVLENRCDEQDLNNLYVTVSDNIHMVSGGILRMSVAKGISSSVSLPIEVNGSITVRTYESKNINLETHNGGNIGLINVHGGDTVIKNNCEGGIVLKTHDGDIVHNTEYRGSIYNIVDNDGNIDMIVNNNGFINLKTYEGTINILSRYKGNINISSRTGDIAIQTTLLGNILNKTNNGRYDVITSHDSNMGGTNTDINLMAHDGNINIHAINEGKCPMIYLKTANSVIIDAPAVYVNQGNLVVDGVVKACKVIADDIICGGQSLKAYMASNSNASDQPSS